MRTVQLGTGIVANKTTSLLGAQEVVDAIAQAVLAEVQSQLADPVVNLSVSPLVQMEPVKVDVSLPEITPEVTVTIPGLDELASEIQGLRTDLASVLSLLSQPTTKTVHRDGAGWIDSVTESR